MFETFFSYSSVIRRHCEAPVALERAAYLRELAAKGIPRGTILKRARYCLCVAVELEKWAGNHCFDEYEIEALARQWAAKRVASGRASGTKWPAEHFRFAATDFLRSIGRLRPPSLPLPGRYDDELADFIATQQQGRWFSSATRKGAAWQIKRFLAYLQQRDRLLQDLTPTDIDGYFADRAKHWSRNSLHTSAKMLRAWLTYCEGRGLVRRGLAAAILLPRIYRQEGLPLGPTWEQVGHMLDQTAGDAPAQLRDHALLLLLSVYALRSGEVRRLALDDIDWRQERIRVVRSKSGREEKLPLEARTGNAIARYLRHGRPHSESRVVFLTLFAPPRPLSAGALYHAVKRQLNDDSCPHQGRGPHGLRHACARHLLEAGGSFKQAGDHLGHRSPSATRIYAKVNLNALRRVVFEDLGGLA